MKQKSLLAAVLLISVVSAVSAQTRYWGLPLQREGEGLLRHAL